MECLLHTAVRSIVRERSGEIDFVCEFWPVFTIYCSLDLTNLWLVSWAPLYDGWELVIVYWSLVVIRSSSLEPPVCRIETFLTLIVMLIVPLQASLRGAKPEQSGKLKNTPSVRAGGWPWPGSGGDLQGGWWLTGARQINISSHSQLPL